MKNKVFIATSLDGYIADKEGKIDWLHSIPNPDNLDMGYPALMDSIDALVMGRTTFETVCNFDIDWPYPKPVYVLSNSLKELPNKVTDKEVSIVSGNLTEILNQIEQNDHHSLYIDGGKTIQSFLKEDLIDEMIITTIPILLGGGFPLFGELENDLEFKCVKSECFSNGIAQNTFVRNRE